MSFLNNTYITLDAVITKKGRECLAKNDGSFNITQFALADDEVDYTLYNPLHPLGSAYYGEAIENMPILEAVIDETQIMQSKLVTLPRGTSKIPIISIGYDAILLKQGASINISPQTLNYFNTTNVIESDGYILTIQDVRFVSNFRGVGLTNTTMTSDNLFLGTQISKSEIGTSFSITATNLNTLFTNTTTITTSCTVVGKNSGARITIPLTITKV
jgi:hypothetical protein